MFPNNQSPAYPPFQQQQPTNNPIGFNTNFNNPVYPGAQQQAGYPQTGPFPTPNAPTSTPYSSQYPSPMAAPYPGATPGQAYSQPSAPHAPYPGAAPAQPYSQPNALQAPYPGGPPYGGPSQPNQYPPTGACQMNYQPVPNPYVPSSGTNQYPSQSYQGGPVPSQNANYPPYNPNVAPQSSNYGSSGPTAPRQSSDERFNPNQYDAGSSYKIPAISHSGGYNIKLPEELNLKLFTKMPKNTSDVKKLLNQGKEMYKLSKKTGYL